MSALLTEAGKPLLGEIIKSAGNTVARNAGKLGRGVVDRVVVRLELGFKSFLDISYGKCRYFKSILNGNVPLDVKTH